MLNLTGECEVKDIKHFQKLPDELVSVVKGLLSEFMDPCKQMIRDLINIEKSYINTQHPDFLKATHAYRPITQPKKGEPPSQEQQGFFVQFFGPAAEKRTGMQGVVDNMTAPAPTGGRDWTPRERRGVDMIKVPMHPCHPLGSACGRACQRAQSGTADPSTAERVGVCCRCCSMCTSGLCDAKYATKCRRPLWGCWSTR